MFLELQYRFTLPDGGGITISGGQDGPFLVQVSGLTPGMQYSLEIYYYVGSGAEQVDGDAYPVTFKTRKFFLRGRKNTHETRFTVLMYRDCMTV